MLIQANSSNFRVGRPGGISYIVIHYTANKGDTARGNCGYFQGANRQASAHYFVDENEVMQSVVDQNTAWHCGVDYSGGNAPYWGKCSNGNSIGIEMCSDYVNGDYVITQATQDRTIELVKTLMAAYNIPADRVIRHFDVCGKICPEPFVMHPEQWTNFKNRLNGSQKPATPTNSYYPYTIIQTTTDGLNIRKEPNTNCSIVGCITDRNKYTIVDEQNGFGKLKSGAGWIYLKYTKRA